MNSSIFDRSFVVETIGPKQIVCPILNGQLTDDGNDLAFLNHHCEPNAFSQSWYLRLPDESSPSFHKGKGGKR